MSFEKQPPQPLDIVSQRLLSQTPLHYACYKGDVQLVSSLLEKALSYNSDEQAAQACVSAMIEEEDSINGWTPAHWASFYGQLACLMKLHIRPNVGFDTCTVRANTSPLHLAAQTGAILCVKWLLQCGACINRQDFMGETALHKAAKAGNTDSAAMLISHGSALELKNHRGCTPADLAQLGNHPTLAQLLKRHADHSRVPKAFPLPISDLNIPTTFQQAAHSDSDSYSPFTKMECLIEDGNQSAFISPSSTGEEESKSSGSGCCNNGSISMNGEDIHHHNSLIYARRDFDMSSESISSCSSNGPGCDGGGSTGLSNFCRMKRSLDVMDDEEEEEMEDTSGLIQSDSKRRCFVSSQDQTPMEKHGDAYNNNVISSYNAVLAMRVEPLQQSPCPPQEHSVPDKLHNTMKPCQSLSAMEHQESMVAEQGYNSSMLMTAFNNVFM